MKCLICNKEMKARGGKEVCSTTCRVNKHKAMKVCDRLLEHFLNDNVTYKRMYSRDNVKNRAEYKKYVIEEIVKLEGKIGESWAKKLE